MNLREMLKKGDFVGLAPMDGYTDEPFRLLLSQIAPPDLYFTEFVSAEGLAHGAVKLFDQLLFSPSERPIVAQLFGKDPEAFRIASNILLKLGFDGIDINFGCPDKTVFGNGSGAAIIGNYHLAEKIISAVKQGISDQDITLKPKIEKIILPLFHQRGGWGEICPTISVKTRLGINRFNPRWFEFLDRQGLDFITLHGRTRHQAYSGYSSWHRISQITKKCQTPIIGNGDLRSRSQAVAYCRKYGTVGALVGRAALSNPWLFIDKSATWPEKFQALIMHAHHFHQIFPHRRFDCLRKNFLLYTSGHPHARQLRAKIIAINSLEAVYTLEPFFLNC